ncbi:Zn-dependent oligopeptidase [Methanocalculus taiwanensis]|uniref:Zn-dependent oligopeptidase n=1 Tax=Methanocalculus taiwanensis TaxID=106207 RepID=A0ABD4TMU9_9EURY|nr:M3 family metallopeptidase [Methanocalculus taiwanensis]MCQ1539099.1 Zn-dependent oligopeptidase [Methanocalculus taiwanensis]
MSTISSPRKLIFTISLLLILSALIGAAGCLSEEQNQNPATGTEQPIQAEYAPGEITLLYAEAENKARAGFDAIADIPADKRTFENTFLAFDTIFTDYTDLVHPMLVMGYVHPDPTVREEGMAADEALSVFTTETYARRDLYDALADQLPRTADEKRLRDVIVRRFEKQGLHLDDDQLEEVIRMKNRIAALEAEYNANLNSDNTTLIFSEEELRGLPPSTLAGFGRTETGACIVTTSYPDYIAVMSYADLSETRKRMLAANNAMQGDKNIPLLEEAIQLRQKVGRELGYDTWADYQIDGRMAGDADSVMAFLNDLKDPLREKREAEFATLLSIKQRNEPGAESLDPWDIMYLTEIYKTEEYGYSTDEVKEYFPLDRVLDGLFEIYESLYGIIIEEVDNPVVWHPDVRLFKISDEADGTTIAHLYLDLYPREGKYNHFVIHGLESGRMTEEGYAQPSAVIVGNFNTPQVGKPTLLTIDEVWTLFHEMGHATHNLLTRAPYGILSGFEVEWDFVETPSQAFEEWIYDPAIMESISGHYTDPEQKIPPDLRDRVIASEDFGKGYTYSSLLLGSLQDMIYHTTDGPVDTVLIYRELHEELRGMPAIEGTQQPASFSHLMGGYDAGYYGYLWSKVYAMNIVERFKEDGMTSRTTGMAYRRTVLERGNMADGMVLLTDFLGEEPGIEPLYRFLRIEG